MLDLWVGILRATGGAIRPDKSFWYLISWHFRNGKWSWQSQDQTPGEIRVHDADNQLRNLDRLAPNEARKTLGVFVAPNGNWRKQIDYLKEKSRVFASQLETNFISRSEAWYAFRFSFLKAIEYLALAIQLSREEWDDVLRPAMSTVLQKVGFPATFPRKIGIWSY